MHKKCNRLLPALVLLPFFLFGCGTTPGEPPTIDRLKPILRLAVTLGTQKVLAERPAAKPVILQVCHTLYTLFQEKEVVTPALLQTVIRARLDKANLTPEMQLIIDALLTTIKVELQAVIRQAELPDSQAVLLVQEVLSWICEVAGRQTGGGS